MSEDRLMSLLLAWQEQWQQGRDVPASELCHDCPELAEELSQRISVLRQMKVLIQPAGPPPLPFGQDVTLDRMADTRPPDSANNSLTETLGSGDRIRPPASPVPCSVPGHEILGELGRGGMGVVYKARQLKLNRLVALKMILAGGHTDIQDLKRFCREAEAVAALQHPHIVQIFEIGEQDGLPYFSLEYVEGGSLAKRLNGTPLPSRQAAALVETLARAMQAAHERGIVHRDLKPSNVLLTAEGTPKIADFGLAKRLDGHAGQTQTGSIVGTPSYMAPEQARGRSKEVGPATDVYALGAILYELLTGRPPFRAETPLETVLQVRSDEPLPPSRLQPKLPRDLETICLKCLRKEPARRYASARELAADLDRFLGQEPITARPVSVWERAWKWARRRPAVATLLGLLLVVVGGSLLALTGLWRRAEQARAEAQQRSVDAEEQRDEARKQKERAENSYRLARAALSDSLELQKDPRFRQGPLEDVRRKLLHAEATFYQQFVAQRGDDPTFQNERSGALARLGAVTHELANTDEAIKYYEEARAIQGQLAHDHPSEAAHRNALARYEEELGALYRATGRTQAAEAAHVRARELRQELLRHDSAVPAYRQDLAAGLVSLGRLYVDANRHREAETIYGEALELLQQLTGEFPDVAVYQRDLGECHNRLGLLYSITGRASQAETAFGQARDLYQRLARRHPDDPAYQEDLAYTHHNFAYLYSTTSRFPQAEEAYRQAQDRLEELLRLHPLVTAYQRNLASFYLNLGAFYSQAGRPPQALTATKKAREGLERLASQNPSVLGYQHDLAKCNNNLALLYSAAGQTPKAEAAFREAVKLYQGLVQQQPARSEYGLELGGTCGNLGQLLIIRGQPEAALPWYDQAQTILEPLATGKPEAALARLYLRNSYAGRAQALTALGRHGEAVKAWDRVLELEWGPQRAGLRVWRAQALARASKADLAAAEAEELGRQQQLTDAARYELARVYGLCAGLGSASPAQVETHARRALDLLRQAQANGYFKDAARLGELDREKDLDALRRRAEFRALRTELSAKAKP
jgi:tetratricopeptide (TPR) repeat protein/tRNA A-37 threonylcarbamoyl transferase component Bud32